MTLYDKICSPDLIAKCAKTVKYSKPKHRRKISRGIDNVTIEEFFENEKEQVESLLDILKNRTFRFSDLKGIAIPKENSDKDRLITAPTVRDRIVQKAILAVINPIFFPYINTGSSYCGVKENIFSKTKNGLNARKAIEKLIWHIRQRHFWTLKADIEKFFDKVPKDKIYSKIESLLVSDASLNSLIKSMIYFHVGNSDLLETNSKIDLPKPEIGVSQGSSLSPLFANVYLEDFDRAINKEFGDVMIRYVDDLLIVAESEEEILKIKNFIESYLKEKGLRLSPKEEKTYIRNIQRERLEFLGLELNRTFIREKDFPKIMKYIQNDLFNPRFEEYRHLKTWLEKIECMNQKIQGLFNYYRYYHVGKLIKSINSLITIQIRQQPAYKGLNLLDTSKVQAIITPEEWQKLFRNKFCL